MNKLSFTCTQWTDSIIRTESTDINVDLQISTQMRGHFFFFFHKC